MRYTSSRRRMRKALFPWLLAGVGVWLAFDTGPGLLDTFRFTAREGTQTDAAAFVTHGAADGLQPGGAVGVRYLGVDPAVHRIEEPGLLLLSFRLLISLALGVLCMALLLAGRVRSESPLPPSKVPA